MFLSVLAVTAILTSPASPYAPAPTAPAPALSASAVILDCGIAGQALIDCKVVGEGAAAANSATALRLAADIQVPVTLAEANPGRIRIKLNVNP